MTQSGLFRKKRTSILIDALGRLLTVSGIIAFGVGLSEFSSMIAVQIVSELFGVDPM